MKYDPTQMTAILQKARKQKVIHMIEQNKAFFAEYLQNTTQKVESVQTITYIGQWYATLKPKEQTQYTHLRQTVEALLENKSTVKNKTREVFEELADATDKKNPKEGRLIGEAVNQHIEHHNAMSSTIKGALQYRDVDPITNTAADIRPHDYLWRYEQNGRLDKFLDNNPEFVDLLITNEAIILELGRHYQQWWDQHKRRPARVQKNAQLEQPVTTQYRQQAEFPLKNTEVIKQFFRDLSNEPKIILNQGLITFQPISGQYPNILMHFTCLKPENPIKLSFLISIDTKGYHLEGNSFDTLSALLRTVTHTFKQAIEEPFAQSTLQFRKIPPPPPLSTP